MSTLIRGHSLPLRLTIPPLRTLLGFACSVASLSRCPNHYPPGHHCLRCAALVECPLGQGEPSTRPEGHYESTCTSLTSFHSDDRRTWPLPAEQGRINATSAWRIQFFFSNVLNFVNGWQSYKYNEQYKKYQQIYIMRDCGMSRGVVTEYSMSKK